MSFMKAVFLPGNKQVEIRQVEIPQPGPGEVLIEVKASCICRSDLSIYEGKRVWDTPMILGHEGAGIVEEVGSAVDTVRPGDRTRKQPRLGRKRPLRSSEPVRRPDRLAHKHAIASNGALAEEFS